MAETPKNDPDGYKTWAVFACQAKRPNYRNEMEEAERSKVVGLNTKFNAAHNNEGRAVAAPVRQLAEVRKRREEMKNFLFWVQAIEGNQGA